MSTPTHPPLTCDDLVDWTRRYPATRSPSATPSGGSAPNTSPGTSRRGSTTAAYRSRAIWPNSSANPDCWGMQPHGHGCGVGGALWPTCRAGGRRTRQPVVGVGTGPAMFAIASFGPTQSGSGAGMATRPARLLWLTEPDVGSDPAAMSRARRDGPDCDHRGQGVDHQRLGHRRRSCGPPPTTESADTDTPGFARQHHRSCCRCGASITSELVLDNVRPPADAMLPGDRPQAAGMPVGGALRDRPGVMGAGQPGSARSTTRDSAPQLGRPIAGFQLTQAKLVDMAVELQ